MVEKYGNADQQLTMAKNYGNAGNPTKYNIGCQLYRMSSTEKYGIAGSLLPKVQIYGNIRNASNPMAIRLRNMTLLALYFRKFRYMAILETRSLGALRAPTSS